MKKHVLFLLSLVLLICTIGCSGQETLQALPAASPDPESQFDVDLNINVDTIDQYLGRDDTVYIDLRMISDPAQYEQIGGDSDLSVAIKGFTCVPYPYIATLQALPVDGAYEGKSLYSVVWDENQDVLTAEANYVESELFMNEVFPKDKNIFLCCGGGGYSFMTRKLLIYLGWDPAKIYVVGAIWDYTGNEGYSLRETTEDGTTYIASWRIDYKYVDFSELHYIGD